MAPSTSCGSTSTDKELLAVDILLPNGVIIPLLCYRHSTLKVIKQRVWTEAKRYPLYRALQSPNSYTFVVVSGGGERQQLRDENTRLCDLSLFWPTLCLVSGLKRHQSRK